tara:strand:- start:2006 stop:3550 length:1545 start_codon:yes stop_codon:yes gene_type:complete
MASTFKNLSPDDKISTKTLLHEAIPITGTIVSGTYADNNIKNFSHGMFQSVYDYPYLSSSANHIFDISTGFANSSALSASTTDAAAQRAKKINIYNQMAQVLVGYDKTGSIQLFDEDGDIAAGGTKLTECMFLSFSRLLVKDEIKKGTFELSLGIGSTYAAPFASTIAIKDHKASTSFKINSPVGEYGILYATGAALDTTLTGSGDYEGYVKCGLIYYQAGVAILSSSIFKSDHAMALDAIDTTSVANDTLLRFFVPTAAGGETGNSNITEIFLDAGETTNPVEGAHRIAVGSHDSQTDAQIAAQIIHAINGTTGANVDPASSGNGQGTVGIQGITASVGSTSTKITLTATTAGTAANSITVTDTGTGAHNIVDVGTFTGGGEGGILSLATSTSRLDTDNKTIDSIMTDISISGSADALRHRIQNVQFNNTVELNSTIYFCRINHNEYNYSANPTYLSSSQIRVKENSTDNPIAYITTVGLYSADNQLLAVGKLSEPLRKDPTIEYTLRARLDY